MRPRCSYLLVNTTGQNAVLIRSLTAYDQLSLDTNQLACTNHNRLVSTQPIHTNHHINYFCGDWYEIDPELDFEDFYGVLIVDILYLLDLLC